MISSERRGKRAEREERRGKGAERDERRETGGERREKSAERSEKRETSTIETTGLKEAMVRSQNGEAQGRVDWKRNGWPDAKFEGEERRDHKIGR